MQEISRIFCGILSIPQNIVMDLNNVMNAIQFTHTHTYVGVACEEKNPHVNVHVRNQNDTY